MNRSESIENDEVSNTDTEEEPIPAWMRYMPRTKRTINQPKAVRDKLSGLLDTKTTAIRKNISSKVHPSSNRFGPTSIKGKDEGEKKRKRSNEDVSEEKCREKSEKNVAKTASNTIGEREYTSTKRIKRIPNMDEAAMLLSFCDMKK